MTTAELQPADSTAPLRAMAPRYYLDPEIYAREKERIFFRTWQYACHRAEVANPGDYVTFRIADQSLFVQRGGDGELRAFYNVCQHRAHELLEGSGNAKQIVCPYHAWRYGSDGRLKSAPNARSVPGFDASAICLTQVRLESFCGFLFVNLDPEAAPMAEWYPDAEAGLRAAVPEIDDFAPFWSHHTDEGCNWKVAVENYNECYHCRLVHPSFTKGVIAADSVDIRPHGYSLRHNARGVASERASYGFDAEEAGYRVWFLWPAFSVQVYPGKVVNSYHWRSEGIAETRVYRGWFAPGGDPSEETRRIAEIDRDTTFAEDLSILNAVQRGLASRGYAPGPLVLDPKGGVDSEHSIQAFYGWVYEALES